jgi:hypothetical protein
MPIRQWSDTKRQKSAGTTGRIEDPAGGWGAGLDFGLLIIPARPLSPHHSSVD